LTVRVHVAVDVERFAPPLTVFGAKRTPPDHEVDLDVVVASVHLAALAGDAPLRRVASARWDNGADRDAVGVPDPLIHARHVIWRDVLVAPTRRRRRSCPGVDAP
jgi:hypothetical protein